MRAPACPRFRACQLPKQKNAGLSGRSRRRRRRSPAAFAFFIDGFFNSQMTVMIASQQDRSNDRNP
jgi:hypothetical protein